MVIKSIFQIFADEPLAEVFPQLEQLMTDNDRHKQRAAAEVIGGMQTLAGNRTLLVTNVYAVCRAITRY